MAVLGSLMASRYSSAMARGVAGLPEAAAEAARSSLRAALEVVGGVGGSSGAALARAARQGFVDAMGASLLVAALAVLAGAGLVARFMPARPAEPEPGPGEGPVEALGQAPAPALARPPGADR